MKLVFNYSDKKSIKAEIVRRGDEQKRRVPREGESVFYSIGDGNDIEARVTNVQYHYWQKEGSSHTKSEIVVLCDVVE